jgi:hypothetical protein
MEARPLLEVGAQVHDERPAGDLPVSLDELLEDCVGAKGTRQQIA